ncbi:MAG: hypothetical protein LBQ02_01905 [Candidatus Nomurabacteria bacterium]|nr:hypothetical protein [Candidatus Nomurabacteria bacterium]
MPTPAQMPARQTQPLTTVQAQTPTSPAPAQSQTEVDYLSTDYGRIAPQKRKKNKLKKLIILAAIVILGGGIAAFVFLRPKSYTPAEIISAFNTYSNYLLSGEKSDRPLEGEWEPLNEFTFYQLDLVRGNSQEDVTAYYNELKTLFGDFAQKYHSADTDTPEDLDGMVENYQTNLDFYYTYVLTESVSEEALSEKYFAEGVSSAVTYAEQFYKDLKNSENEYTKQYGELQAELSTLWINVFNEYQNNDCFRDGALDEDCTTVQYFTNTQVQSYNKRIREAKDTIEDLQDSARVDLLSGCWSISEKLTGLTESQDE